MISQFNGHYRWLSNFWPAEVTLDGKTYPTVEHAYQAAKTHDAVEREIVRSAPTPGIAKRLSRKNTQRKDWALVKVIVMEGLLRQKFSNVELRFNLHLTKGQELIEGNTWGDTFWGVCNGKGENHLGRLLMKLREEIK